MGDDDDDEEQNKQPDKYEFSTESKLDEDHLFYLQFTNNFISNVTRPRDFDHCTRWLERLAGEPMYGVEAKRNRNIYLAMLLCAMQDNKVKGPFGTFPPAGPLPNAAVAFGIASPEEDGKEGSMMFEEFDRELNMDNYKYKSQDGRTYIATCKLPNNGGVMAFVGLTIGGGEGLWLNKDGVQIPSKSEDRIPTITTKTSFKKQFEMIQAHKDLVRSGQDQEPEELDEDAFMFLTNLPVSTSDSNLLQLGSYKFNKQDYESLLETYPEEFVQQLEEFLIVSKKEIERRYRLRHDKVGKYLYKEYAKEIERGLQEYKDARQEWATIFQVVAELKEVLAEKEAKENKGMAQFSDTSNRPTGVMLNALNDAKRRQKLGYELGKVMDEKHVEIHKEIHERAMFHTHEIEKAQGHIDKLIGEICNLRRDARKKQMVINGLVMQLDQARNG